MKNGKINAQNKIKLGAKFGGILIICKKNWEKTGLYLNYRPN